MDESGRLEIGCAFMAPQVRILPSPPAPFPIRGRTGNVYYNSSLLERYFSAEVAAIAPSLQAVIT